MRLPCQGPEVAPSLTRISSGRFLWNPASDSKAVKQRNPVVTNLKLLGAVMRYRSRAVVLERPAVRAGLGCAVGAVPEANHRIRLRAFLPFDDVELHIVAFFKRFVAVQLDCRIVDEYIRPVLASDESVALGVVEPLDLTFVLSHRLLPSLGLSGIWEVKRGTPPRIF